MLAVEKWAQGKNPFIAYMAIMGALAAREQHETLRHIKERCIYGFQFTLPDFPTWFSMYRSRKPLFAYKRLISHNSEFKREQLVQLNEFRKLDKALKLDPNLFKNFKFTQQEINESLEYWNSMCSDIFTDIRDNIKTSRFDSALEKKLRAEFKQHNIPLCFYFLVYAPCQIYYKSSPSNLYRKAINGNLNAIQQLISLDPLALHDHAIGFQIQSIRLNGKKNDYDDILNAITRHPTINYKDAKETRKSIKSDNGALILVLAKSLNGALKVPQIIDLFDKLAMDFGDNLQDDDITSKAGFEKTLKTKAVEWQDLHQKTEEQR